MYKKRESSWLKHLDFIVMDFIVLQVAFVLAHLIRYRSLVNYGTGTGLSVSVVVALMDLIAGPSMQNYKDILRRSYKRELLFVLKFVSTVYVGAILWLFLTKESAQISRLVMVLFPTLSVVLVYCCRLGLKALLRKRKRVRRGILLVCEKNNCKQLIDNFVSDPISEFQIRGVMLMDGEEPEGFSLPEGAKRIADGDALIHFLLHEWVDAVFLCTELDPDSNDELVTKCLSMGITVHRALAKVHIADTPRVLERVGGYMVVTQSINMVDSRRLFIKRCTDIFAGFIGVLLTGILCLILGPIIYLKSPGPIFFKQERIGENGRRFFIYKFRSMYMDAEERKKELMEKNNIKDGRMFKVDNDPRIIKGIGNFIRNYSLDEFPQFWNVLKGDMSLIGTRPPTPDEWEKYELHHRSRLAVKPGITGIWQVSGRSDITDFEEVVQMDVDYIKHWSLALDVKIIFKTIGVIFKKKGAENR